MSARRVKPIVFEEKRDTADIFLQKGLPIMSWEDCIINALQVPPGANARVWGNKFTDLFIKCFSLYASSRLILDSVSVLYWEYRTVISKKNVYPGLFDLYDYIRVMKPKTYAEIQYVNSFSFSLKSLLRATGDVYKCGYSNIIEQICEAGACIQLSGLEPPENRKFFVSHMLQYVHTWRTSGSGRES